jgi:2-polyprenyl-3-methyl-5-hydroxy-6-metoxy-1,4-benzoquinol methylase
MAGASRAFRNATLAYLLREIAPGCTVLDCGAGDGGTAIPIAALNACEVHAFDLKADRIALMDRLRGDVPVTGYAGDLFELDFGGRQFDYVISRQFIAHFEDRPFDVLRRKLALCRPGG